MATHQIIGGSEKQNTWANKIASGWIAQLQNAIDTAHVDWHKENLIFAMGKLMNGLDKITAIQVINLEEAKRSPVLALLKQALVNHSQNEDAS
jgi:hypothetical protein